MKQLRILSAALLLVLVAAACSEEDPSIRVRNDFDKKANVQLKPAAGNTININDVEGGTTSVFHDVQEGEWTATASISSVSESPEKTFRTENDMNYTVVIINAQPPTMEIVAEDK